MLQKRGERLTQINLAKESGLTRQTVAKYKDVLNAKYADNQGIIVKQVLREA